MSNVSYDFSGWATRNDVVCSDGRIIRKDAFAHNDGETVSLVYGHKHGDMDDIIGNAVLENRPEGVYAYGTLNDSYKGQLAKKLIQHGDLRALSIYANGLKEKGNEILHGTIRELSVVLSGANPGAYIDTVIAHDAYHDAEAIIHMGYIDNAEGGELMHADDGEKEEKPMADEKEQKEKTVGDVMDTLTDEQKAAVAYVLQAALAEEDDTEEDDKGGNTEMKHNAFDVEETVQGGVLSHDAMMNILADAKRCGSLKESFLQHAADEVEDATGFGGLGYARDAETGLINPSYGVGNLDYMFPDARLLGNTPEFIKRDTNWVQKVLNGAHHSPFSRIKSLFADITEDEARAKGYIKGKQKKEEIFGLLKRTASPTTIYKKQKMDRDDILDITDFDVVAWIKSEMRIMLDEELARAALIGDGRSSASDDKINELCIRPIFNDADLFTIKAKFEYNADGDTMADAKEFIRTVIKSRKNYKGSGNPTLFTTEDMLTDCLLIEDLNGRVIYDTEEKLRTALRVKEIVTVPVMEGLVDTNSNDVLGIIVNMADYTFGADKGGSVSMFDDFDIDYNQQKYLIETRCSGMLTKPFSAITITASSNVA